MSALIRARSLSASLFTLALVAYLVAGLTIARPAVAAPAGNFISAPGREDICFDDARNVLYITSGGEILRYDLSTEQFIDPIVIGDSLGGIDLSPDGSTLAVADTNLGGQWAYSMNPADDMLNRVYLVDPETGDYETADLPNDFGEIGAWMVAWDANGKLLVTSQIPWGGITPLRRYDPQTGAIDIFGVVTMDTALSPSGDRQTIAFAQANISGGGWGVYHAAAGSISDAPGTWFFNYDVAANHDGTQFTVPANNLRVADARLNPLKQFGTPSGAKYSPNADILYVPTAGTSQIRAYDTDSFGLLRSYDVGDYAFPKYADSWTSPGSMQWPRLAIACDDSVVCCTVAGGVEVFDSRPRQHSPTTIVTCAPEANDAGWNDSGVTVDFDVSDGPGPGVGSTRYRVDAESTATYSTPFAVLAEGVHHVQYWSLDTSGNVEAAKTATIRIDKTGPTVSVDALSAYTGSATIHASASDLVSGLDHVELKVDAGQWSTGAQCATSVLGTHTVYCRAFDVAGNESDVEATFTVVAPDTRPGWITGTVRARLGGPIEGASVTASGGATATTAADGTYLLSDVSPGAHRLTISRAGYAPVGTYTANVSANATVGVNVLLENLVLVSGRVLGTDTNKSVAGTQVRIVDTTGWSNPQTPVTDDEGNWSAWLTAGDFRVDLSASGTYVARSSADAFSIPPTQTGTMVRPDYLQVKQGVVRGHVSQTWRSLSVPYVSIEVWATGPSNPGYPVLLAQADANGDYSVGLPPGTYVMHVQPYDGWGFPQHYGLATPDIDAGQSPINVVSDETTMFNIVCVTQPDTTPPVVSLAARNVENRLPTTGEVWTAGTPGVSVWAVDPRPWGLMSTVSYRVNGGPVQTVDATDIGPLGGPVAVGSYDSGDWHFEYWATDYAGNVSPHGTWTVHIDHEPPSAPTTANALWIGDDVSLRWGSSPSSDVAGYGLVYTKTDAALTQYSDGLPGVSYASVPANQSSWVQRAPGPGDWHYGVFAVDHAGNRGPVQSCVASSDTIAPTTKSDARPTYEDEASVSLSATDDIGGSGVSSLCYRLDDGAAIIVPGAHAVVVTTQRGAHNLEFWAVDAAGNESLHRVSRLSISHREYHLSNVGAPWRVSRTKRFLAKVSLTPAYSAGGTPVTFYAQHLERGKWVTQLRVPASRVAGSNTAFGAKLRLGMAGKWRVRAVFGDAFHPRRSSTYRRITAV